MKQCVHGLSSSVRRSSDVAAASGRPQVLVSGRPVASVRRRNHLRLGAVGIGALMGQWVLVPEGSTILVVPSPAEPADNRNGADDE